MLTPSPGRPSYLPIHYGKADGSRKVLCASEYLSLPSTKDWRYVTCFRCLEMGAELGSPTARKMLDKRQQEEQGGGA